MICVAPSPVHKNTSWQKPLSGAYLAADVTLLVCHQFFFFKSLFRGERKNSVNCG